MERQDALPHANTPDGRKGRWLGAATLLLPARRGGIGIGRVTLSRLHRRLLSPDLRHKRNKPRVPLKRNRIPRRSMSRSSPHAARPAGIRVKLPANVAALPDDAVCESVGLS